MRMSLKLMNVEFKKKKILWPTIANNLYATIMYRLAIYMLALTQIWCNFHIYLCWPGRVAFYFGKHQIADIKYTDFLAHDGLFLSTVWINIGYWWDDNHNSHK